jgi:Arc/MetJ-type ribon-helix-helix transcriptional regulator
MTTERLTLRLDSGVVHKIDTLVELGQYGTRTEVVRSALRMFLEHEGAKAKDMIAAEEGMMELQKLRTKKEALKAEILGMLDNL